MKVEIEIFYDTEQTDELIKLGIEVSEEMLDIRKVTFYRIDAIEQNNYNDKNYSTINCSCVLNSSPIPYKTLKKLIEEQ
jgi:hypothetical protein